MKHSYFKGMQEVVINNTQNPILENLSETSNLKQNIKPNKKLDSPPIHKQSIKGTNDTYLYPEPIRKPNKVKDSMDEFDDIIKDLETKNIMNTNNSKNNSINLKTNTINSFNQNRSKDDPFNNDFFQNNKLLMDNRQSNSSKKPIVSVINNNDIEDYVSNKKLLYKEKTKPELTIQKKKIDSFFQNESPMDKQYEDIFFNEEFNKQTNKTKTNNAENISLFQEAEERKYSSTLKKQNVSKQNKFHQNDDLLEELFGDDLFGGSKPRLRSPIINKDKNSQKSNHNKNAYEDLFNTNQDTYFDTKDRISPWSGERQEKTFQTRRSRYIPGINSGKKDNLSKPTSGKWNQVFTNSTNSATKTGIENQKSSYIPSFLNSGNESSKKGE